jgi:hypothetical protein
MKAFYNENDPLAAAWLRGLADSGSITEGTVCDESIERISGAALHGFERVHFFAGIGGWDYALKLAGWPAGREVWTGSCPCQPFSGAGKMRGEADERHLWPEMRRLIGECRPATIFGEQVASKLGANGSMEYSLTWKQWAIGSREPICALRGSGHRTSDKDYTGWQTPTVEDSARAGSADDYMKYVNHGQTSGCRLRSQAQIAGWPTPNCADVNASRSSTPQAYSKRWMERENHGSQLAHTAQALVGWPTASARDAGMRKQPH